MRSWPWCEAIAPGFGGINLEDISAPRCFEIEDAPDRGARHPGVPRRPARDRGGGARGAAERAASDGPSGSARYADRGRGLGAAGVAVSPDPAGGGRAAHHRLSTRGARCRVDREPTTWTDACTPVKRALAEVTNLERRSGSAGRGARGRRPVHRAVRRAGDAGLGAGTDEPGPDRVRDGQPGPRGRARGGRCRTRGSSPPAARTTPTRSTTCSASRACSAARWTSAPPRITEYDEDRGRAGDRRRSSPTTSCARTTSSRRCSTATWRRRWPPRWPPRRAPAGPAEAGAELGFGPTEEFGALPAR